MMTDRRGRPSHYQAARTETRAPCGRPIGQHAKSMAVIWARAKGRVTCRRCLARLRAQARRAYR